MNVLIDQDRKVMQRENKGAEMRFQWYPEVFSLKAGLWTKAWYRKMKLKNKHRVGHESATFLFEALREQICQTDFHICEQVHKTKSLLCSPHPSAASFMYKR